MDDVGRKWGTSWTQLDYDSVLKTGRSWAGRGSLDWTQLDGSELQSSVKFQEHYKTMFFFRLIVC